MLLFKSLLTNDTRIKEKEDEMEHGVGGSNKVSLIDVFSQKLSLNPLLFFWKVGVSLMIISSIPVLQECTLYVLGWQKNTVIYQ